MTKKLENSPQMMMSVLIVKLGVLWGTRAGMRAGTKDQFQSVRVNYREEE